MSDQDLLIFISMLAAAALAVVLVGLYGGIL